MIPKPAAQINGSAAQALMAGAMAHDIPSAKTSNLGESLSLPTVGCRGDRPVRESLPVAQAFRTV
jgi:hypothetical protein